MGFITYICYTSITAIAIKFFTVIFSKVNVEILLMHKIRDIVGEKPSSHFYIENKRTYKLQILNKDSVKK